MYSCTDNSFDLFSLHTIYLEFRGLNLRTLLSGIAFVSQVLSVIVHFHKEKSFVSFPVIYKTTSLFLNRIRFENAEHVIAYCKITIYIVEIYKHTKNSIESRYY